MLDLVVSADEMHLADLLERGGEARSGGTDLADLLEPGGEADLES